MFATEKNISRITSQKMGSVTITTKHGDHDDEEDRPANSRAGWTVTIMAALIMFCVTSQLTYLADIQPTIQKRFGLTEAESGNIILANDVAQVTSIMIMTHFLSKLGKARGIGLSVLVMITGIVLWIVPHFLNIKAPSSMYNTTEPKVALCGRNHTETCDVTPPLDDNSLMAYRLFVAGQVLFGIGWAPAYSLGLPMIAANVKASQIPLFIGLAWAMDSLGTVAGTYLTIGFLNIPENVTSSQFTPSDQAWVGAWWLGLIVMAAFTLIVTIILCVLSEKMGWIQKDQPVHKENVFKGLFLSVWRLIRNLTFVCFMLAGAFKFYVFSGLFMYLPQFLEVQFDLNIADSKHLVVILTGVVPAVGVVTGGIIATKLRYGRNGSGIGLLVLISLLAAGLIGVLLAIGCPQHMLAGEKNIDGSVTGNLPCSSSCNCPSDLFSPVCADGLNYLTPCHAGCSVGSHANYSSCACTSKVTAGLCELRCNNLVPYAIIFSAAMFVLFMTDALYLCFSMRVVATPDRPMAVAVITAFMTLIAFLPAPVLFENILSGACIWRPFSCGKSGDCQLYDLIQYRFLYHSTALVFLLVATGFLGGAWYLLRSKDDKKEKGSTDNLPNNMELYSVAYPDAGLPDAANGRAM